MKTALKDLIADVKIAEENAVHETQIVVFSNAMYEPYLGLFLRNRLAKRGYRIKYRFLKTEMTERPDYEALEQADIVIIDFVLLLFADDLSQMSFCNRQIETISELIIRFADDADRRMEKGELILFSLEDYCYPSASITGKRFKNSRIADAVNWRLGKICKDRRWTLLDKKRLLADIGLNKAYNRRGRVQWDMVYSPVAIDAMAEEIEKQFCIQKHISAKCVVLDCDNVLWGGVLSENGADGIELGTHGEGLYYREFQCFIKLIHNMGVIVCLCTKNDLQDIQAVFTSHSGMVLKDTDISYWAAGWGNKSRGLLEIAEALSISTDSMVFVDDSLSEINEIREILPEVKCILFRRDEPYNDFGKYFSLGVMEDRDSISARQETYQTNVIRRKLKENEKDYRSYLNKLDTQLRIVPVQETELDRIATLLLRTNKCTNGKRLTRRELSNRYTDPAYDLFSVYVRDCFSDLGLTGVMIVREDTHLEAFALSCRVLGRDLEQEMIAFLSERYKLQTIDFADTGKNEGLRVQLEKMI